MVPSTGTSRERHGTFQIPTFAFEGQTTCTHTRPQPTPHLPSVTYTDHPQVDRIDWADPLLYAPRLFYGGQNDELRITAWDEIVKREDMPVPFGPLAIWLQIRFKSGLVGSKIVMLLWEADEEVRGTLIPLAFLYLSYIYIFPSFPFPHPSADHFVGHGRC